MKTKFLIVTFLVVFFGFPININAQLKINAQYRNRFEIRDGYRELNQDGSNPAIFISQRTRLTFNYQTEKLKLWFTPQDVRVWGDENIANSTGVYGNTASLDLFEGYIELKVGNSLWLSIGRQPFVYDNQRLFAERNWNQFGLCYDGLLAKMEYDGWNFHVASSWNSLNEAVSDIIYPESRIKSLSFLWINKNHTPNFTTSLLHIASGVTKTDSTNTLNFRQTTGLYSKYNHNKLALSGDYYYQYGKNNKGSPVSAFLFDIDVSYKFRKLTPAIGIGFLSGNSKVDNNQITDNLFDILYGARHKYFGYMDYFRNFSKHTNEGGLIDYFFRLEYNVSKSISIKNIGHYFQLSQTNASTPSDKNLGYENDFVAKYKFNEWGALECGYAFIFPTESLKTIQKTSTTELPQFLYLQLTIKPSIL